MSYSLTIHYNIWIQKAEYIFTIHEIYIDYTEVYTDKFNLDQLKIIRYEILSMFYVF